MRLDHGETRLELHPLRRAGEGGADVPPLLLLHALGRCSRDWGAAVRSWPGDVHGLDFSGHGGSGCTRGGAYTPEHFAAEADAALAVLAAKHPICIAGAGLGAYVALLIAGARAASIRAALLLPGRGLAGGGPLPVGGGVRVPEPPGGPETVRPDPLVFQCELDVRPTDYAGEFAAAAQHLFVAEMDAPPPWLEAARQQGPVETVPAGLPTALERFAAALALKGPG